MRRILAAVLVFTALMPMAHSALAEEPAKYNFASVQGAQEIVIIPGGEGVGKMYFYNIEGNRITHIILEISQAPTEWQADIQPPLTDTQVEVNGQVVTVTENLYVEPSEASSEEFTSVPEGMVCIPVAQRGYALAKEARINVRVPESQEIGTTGEVIVSATAQWLGQGGAATFSQKRDFTFTVEIVDQATEFNEVILGNNDGGTARWLSWMAGGIAAALLASVILFYVRKRRD